MRGFLILLLILAVTKADGHPGIPFKPLFQQISGDYREFYRAPSLVYQAFALGYGGIMANTNFDSISQQYWQIHIRGNFTDDVSNPIDSYADITQYPVAIPLYFAAQLIGNEAIATWGNHALRTLLLGAPPQGILSYALGGGRPSTMSPQWHILKYHRAVSGHAFYGAIPLITLAKQNDHPTIKWAAYTASVLPALARINMNKHYPSQVFLGWWLAMSAANTVWHTDIVRNKPYTWSWQAFPLDDGIYLGISAKF